MASCLQGQHRPSGQVKVAWRFDAPDSTTMLTLRRSSSLAASTQLRCLHDDFDTALVSVRAEAKSSDEHLTWTDVTVRGLQHDAQRRRLVGGRTVGSL
jgi:hypothetical protein